MLEDSIIASQDEEIRKLLIFQYHYTVPNFNENILGLMNTLKNLWMI